MDKISINNASFSCHIGVTNEEREEKQEIIMDIELYRDIKSAAKTDNIKDTVDYFVKNFDKVRK